MASSHRSIYWPSSNPNDRAVRQMMHRHNVRDLDLSTAVNANVKAPRVIQRPHVSHISKPAIKVASSAAQPCRPRQQTPVGCDVMSQLFVNKVMHACHQHESSESITRMGGAMTSLSGGMRLAPPATAVGSVRSKSKSHDRLLLSHQVPHYADSSRPVPTAMSYNTSRVSNQQAQPTLSPKNGQPVQLNRKPTNANSSSMEIKGRKTQQVERKVKLNKKKMLSNDSSFNNSSVLSRRSRSSHLNKSGPVHPNHKVSLIKRSSGAITTTKSLVAGVPPQSARHKKVASATHTRRHKDNGLMARNSGAQSQRFPKKNSVTSIASNLSHQKQLAGMIQKQADSTFGSTDMQAAADRSRASAIQTLQKLVQGSSQGLPCPTTVDRTINSDIRAIIQAENGGAGTFITTTMHTPKDEQPIDIQLQGIVGGSHKVYPDAPVQNRKTDKTKRVSILPVDPKMQAGYFSSQASLGQTPMSRVSIPQHVSDIKMFEEGFALGEPSNHNLMNGTEFSPEMHGKPIQIVSEPDNINSTPRAALSHQQVTLMMAAPKEETIAGMTFNPYQSRQPMQFGQGESHDKTVYQSTPAFQDERLMCSKEFKHLRDTASSKAAEIQPLREMKPNAGKLAESERRPGAVQCFDATQHQPVVLLKQYNTAQGIIGQCDKENMYAGCHGNFGIENVALQIEKVKKIVDNCLREEKSKLPSATSAYQSRETQMRHHQNNSIHGPMILSHGDVLSTAQKKVDFENSRLCLLNGDLDESPTQLSTHMSIQNKRSMMRRQLVEEQDLAAPADKDEENEQESESFVLIKSIKKEEDIQSNNREETSWSHMQSMSSDSNRKERIVRSLQSKNFMRDYASSKRKDAPPNQFNIQPVAMEIVPKPIDALSSVNDDTLYTKKSLTSIQEVQNSNLERSRGGMPTSSARGLENTEQSQQHLIDSQRQAACTNGDLPMGNTTSSFSYGQAAKYECELSMAAQRPGRNNQFEHLNQPQQQRSLPLVDDYGIYTANPKLDNTASIGRRRANALTNTLEEQETTLQQFVEQSLEKEGHLRDDDDICLLDKLTNERSQMSEGVTTSRGGRTRRGSGPHCSRPDRATTMNQDDDDHDLSDDAGAQERLLNINDALDKSMPQFIAANYTHQHNNSLNVPSESDREAPSLKQFREDEQLAMQMTATHDSQQQQLDDNDSLEQVNAKQVHGISSNSTNSGAPIPPQAEHSASTSSTHQLYALHYQQTQNTMRNLHLLEPHTEKYRSMPTVKLPPFSVEQISSWAPACPKVLLLDIDETMIHCIDDRDPPTMRGTVPLTVNSDTPIDIQINMRPGLLDHLRELRKSYQLVSFTASDQIYADTILDYIEKDGELFSARLYRQHCVETPFGLIKDLRIIANRQMKDMILVDNSALSFAFNVTCGIPILPFFDDESDEELRHLTFYLSCLCEQRVPDIRVNNEESFGLLKLRTSQVSSSSQVDDCGLVNPSEDGLDETAERDPQGHFISKEYLQCDPAELDESIVGQNALLDQAGKRKELCLMFGTSQVIEERSNEGDEDGLTSQSRPRSNGSQDEKAASPVNHCQ